LLQAVQKESRFCSGIDAFRSQGSADFTKIQFDLLSAARRFCDLIPACMPKNGPAQNPRRRMPPLPPAMAHMSFDNNTAELVEGGVRQCAVDRATSNVSRTTSFKWGKR